MFLTLDRSQRMSSKRGKTRNGNLPTKFSGEILLNQGRYSSSSKSLHLAYLIDPNDHIEVHCTAHYSSYEALNPPISG